MSIPTEQPQLSLPLQQPFSNPVHGQERLPERLARHKAPGWAKALILLLLAFLVATLGGDIRQMVTGSAAPPL